MEDWEMAVGGLCGGLAMVLLFSICRRCLGFTTSGVAAGSRAAAFQSGIGDVQKGSLFSMCQSGFSCCTNFFLFAVGAAIAVGLMYLYDARYKEVETWNNSTAVHSNTTDLFVTTKVP